MIQTQSHHPWIVSELSFWGSSLQMLFSGFVRRWDMRIGKTAECQATMTGGTGHFGNCRCLGATTLHKCSMKSRSVKRHTQMLISAVWHSTTSARFSAWLLSFKNLPPPPLPRCFISLRLLSYELVEPTYLNSCPSFISFWRSEYSVLHSEYSVLHSE